MKMKILLPSIIITAILIGALSLGPYHSITKTEPVKPVKSDLMYKGTMCAFLKKADGKVIPLGCRENTLTDIGKNWIEQQMINPNTNQKAVYIAVTDQSDVCSSSSTNIQEITTSDLARAEGTYTDLGNGKWSVEYTFTADQSHPNVQIAGLFWDGTAGSDNNLLACGSFTTVNLEANDQLTIRWNITISEA